MEWWQILLIVLATIAAGIIIGFFLTYFEKRFFIKRHVFVREMPVRNQPAEQPAIKPSPLRNNFPELNQEIESNLKIAVEPWSGKLFAFQTRVWDSLQDKPNQLPLEVREELSQAYIDIRLANSIVRLATEFNRRSHNLDESYIKLSSGIVDRLSKIKPMITRL